MLFAEVCYGLVVLWIDLSWQLMCLCDGEEKVERRTGAAFLCELSVVKERHVFLWQQAIMRKKARHCDVESGLFVYIFWDRQEQARIPLYHMDDKDDSRED